MTNNNNQVSVTYSDTELRNFVEEYITQPKSELTLKGVCSYILYWAIEDGKVEVAKSLIESNELSGIDQKRVKDVPDAVVSDGRITTITCESYRKV